MKKTKTKLPFNSIYLPIGEFKVKDDNSLVEIKEIKFENEKYLQTINEANISNLFGLQFIESEFVTEQLFDGRKKYRYDSLAFDPIEKVFVIIEYKNKKRHSLTDQFLSYLEAVRKSKFKIIYAYNEQFNENLSLKDVNWDKTRVLIIGP